MVPQQSPVGRKRAFDGGARARSVEAEEGAGRGVGARGAVGPSELSHVGTAGDRCGQRFEAAMRRNSRSPVDREGIVDRVSAPSHGANIRAGEPAKAKRNRVGSPSVALAPHRLTRRSGDARQLKAQVVQEPLPQRKAARVAAPSLSAPASTTSLEAPDISELPRRWSARLAAVSPLRRSSVSPVAGQVMRRPAAQVHSPRALRDLAVPAGASGLPPLSPSPLRTAVMRRPAAKAPRTMYEYVGTEAARSTRSLRSQAEFAQARVRPVSEPRVAEPPPLVMRRPSASARAASDFGPRKRPAEAEPPRPTAVEADGTRRSLVRRRTLEAELRLDEAKIGMGIRATVLFHEAGFDCAMISLDRGMRGRVQVELSEHNHNTVEMLYYVVECEHQKVEFELPARGVMERLACGAEVVVPPGVSYVLRNLSRTTNAKLVTLVPHDAA